MALWLTCPTCGKRFSIPASSEGKQVHCLDCGTSLTIPEIVYDADDVGAEEIGQFQVVAARSKATEGSVPPFLEVVAVPSKLAAQGMPPFLEVVGAPSNLAGQSVPPFLEVVAVPSKPAEQSVPPFLEALADDEVAAAEEERQSCPVCGGMIVKSAAKCRFCGVPFDYSLKRDEQQKKTAKHLNVWPDGFEWALCVLFPCLGLILGIVYAVQGKPKGWKMTGVSILVMAVGNVFRLLLLHPVESPY